MGTSELTAQQVRNRLRVAAFKIAARRWPDLVRIESAKPEPNLLKPVQLVSKQQLEDFYFAELCKRVNLNG